MIIFNILPSRFNLCQFDEDLAATDILFEAVCIKWLAPALVSPPHEFHHMSKALMDGAWCIMPILEYGSFLNFTQVVLLISTPTLNTCGGTTKIWNVAGTCWSPQPPATPATNILQLSASILSTYCTSLLWLAHCGISLQSLSQCQHAVFFVYVNILPIVSMVFFPRQQKHPLSQASFRRDLAK